MEIEKCLEIIGSRNYKNVFLKCMFDKCIMYLKTRHCADVGEAVTSWPGIHAVVFNRNKKVYGRVARIPSGRCCIISSHMVSEIR